MSSKFNVTNGVRQGDVLSPLLFNVYVNDLSDCLKKYGVGGSMNGTYVNHMLYADDNCIILLSVSGLQRLLNICDDYCKLLVLIFNAKKSMCIYFSTTMNKPCGLPVIFLGDEVIIYERLFQTQGPYVHNETF